MASAAVNLLPPRPFQMLRVLPSSTAARSVMPSPLKAPATGRLKLLQPGPTASASASAKFVAAPAVPDGEGAGGGGEDVTRAYAHVRLSVADRLVAARSPTPTRSAG